MESEENKDKGFKVQDRRRFSPDGELKPEFSGDEQPVEVPPEPSPGTVAAPGTGPAATSAESASAAQTPGRGFTNPAAGPSPGEITFATFVVGLSTEALVNLGEISDPQSGDPVQNLGAAQQLIDIIGMLQEKTRGNLDHDEKTLVDAILFDLRMKYVERARQAPR
ncbi:MAG: DUF1844 domain-containing protein [Candidatus Binataceae bacterium]